MSNRTDLRRPVVCGDVEPRHALQIEEADEHAQYVTAKDAAEDIALPIFSAVDEFVDIVLHGPQLLFEK